MNVTFDSLRSVMPRAPAEWLSAIVTLPAKWEINTPERVATFVGQLAHESCQFTRLEENLSYSAERLMAVWPKRFPTRDSTKGYARNPEALANRVYALRMGNGAESSGDGWRYRGRGPIQLTGRDNYVDATAVVGVDLIQMPQRMFEPTIGLAAAAWYWKTRGCNELADDENHAGITRKINGGTIGLEDRLEWIAKTREALK